MEFKPHPQSSFHSYEGLCVHAPPPQLACHLDIGIHYQRVLLYGWQMQEKAYAAPVQIFMGFWVYRVWSIREDVGSGWAWPLGSDFLLYGKQNNWKRPRGEFLRHRSQDRGLRWPSLRVALGKISWSSYIAIWGQIILCIVGCVAIYPTSIYQTDTSSTPVVTTNSVWQAWINVPWNAESPLNEKCCSTLNWSHPVWVSIDWLRTGSSFTGLWK